MEMNARQEQLRTQYLARLKKCDRDVLAREVSIMLVLIPLLPVDEILEALEHNSQVERHNKQVKIRNNKIARLKSLAGKKKLSREEKKEFFKLYDDLKIEVNHVA